MQVSFRHGIVRSVPNFLQLTGNTVSIVIPQPDYLTATIADGAANYVISEKYSVADAWLGPFSSGTDYWLYWDIHPLTGAKTYGHTLYPLISSVSAPSSPAHDQHWFDLTTNTTKVWNGNVSRWVHKIRVFAAKLAGGSTFVSVSVNSPSFAGTQVGGFQYTPVLAGFLVYDDTGVAIRKGNGTFFTSEDVGVTGITTTSHIKLAGMISEAEAVQTMARHTVVTFVDFDKITPADPTTITPAAQVGIIEDDVVIGEIVNVVTEGIVTSDLMDWSGVTVNTPLFIGVNGVLSTVPVPPAYSPVAFVSGRNSIRFGVPVSVDLTINTTSPMSVSTMGIARISVPATVEDSPIVVGDNDPRLTNARTPVSHVHAISDVTGLQDILDDLSLLNSIPVMTEVLHGTGRLSLPAASAADPIVVGDNDPRLTDARAPLAHTHTGEYVSVAGDTMTGFLTLSGTPTSALHAAPKSYVDAILTTANTFTAAQRVTPATLTSGSTIAVNAALSNNFRLVLATSATLLNPTNLVNGQILNVVIKQDGVGSRTLAYGTMYKFGASGLPVLSTAANSVDFISCYYDSVDNILICNFKKGT